MQAETKKFNLNMHVARLLMDEPFFASISRRIDKSPSTAIPTAGVKINPDSAQFEMIYNPDFFAGLTDDERRAVLKHEFYHIVYLHVTSPLLSDESLERSIEIYREKISLGYDSLASVEKVKKYLWYDEKPVNYDPDNHPRSQDLPDYVALNFAINIIGRERMIERKNILGKKFYPFLLDEVESVDVDNEFDFILAEYLYGRGQ